MKKKILAILSAAVLGCCALTATAFAEETAAPETEQTYQPGDVDMDGEITAKDALMALQDYVDQLANKESRLIEQQLSLSVVIHLENQSGQRPTIWDATCILRYAVDHTAGKNTTMDEVITKMCPWLKNIKEEFL
ncbi:MAG: hypothetical protein IKQ39_04285 [Oscillospiraceae bacterium]|nr:hypothetical protein [Oscillospiraceae bacterium]